MCSSDLPSGVTAVFYDLVSGDMIFATNPSGSTIQQFTLPAKYFGAASLIGIQLNVSAPPTDSEAYQLTDQNYNVYFSAAGLGISVTIVFNPLQPAYTLQLL